MFEHLRPHRLAHHLTEITSAELATRGVRGLILDLDNTLTPWKCREVSTDVLAWLRQVRAAGIAACLVSNAASTRRVQPVAEMLEIPWVLRAAKPLARGFRHGMTLMGTTPETTAVIGDQVFTDIYGGNCLGLYTILVDPMHPREALITRLLQRPLERLVGRKAKA